MGNKDELLLKAVKEGHIEKAKKAIKDGADVNYFDDKKATILMWAAYKTNLTFVKYLISEKADHSKKGIIYIDEANTTFYGNLNGIATGERNIEMLKYFIEGLGIDVDDVEASNNDNGWTALEWSLDRDYLEITEYLLEQNANPNPPLDYYGHSILHRAIIAQNINAFNLLVEKGADIKPNTSKTLLAEACMRENSVFVRRLLELGLDPNERSGGEFLPLNLAAGNCRLESCKLLIQYGADHNLTDDAYNHNRTALDWARIIECEKVIKYLESLEKG